MTTCKKEDFKRDFKPEICRMDLQLRSWLRQLSLQPTPFMRLGGRRTPN